MEKFGNSLDRTMIEGAFDSAFGKNSYFGEMELVKQINDKLSATNSDFRIREGSSMNRNSQFARRFEMVNVQTGATLDGVDFLIGRRRL